MKKDFKDSSELKRKKRSPEFVKLMKKVRAEVKRRKEAGYTADQAGKDFLEWQDKNSKYFNTK